MPELPTSRPPADWFLVYAYEVTKVGQAVELRERGRPETRNYSEVDLEGLTPQNAEDYARKIANRVMMDFAHREISPADEVTVSEDDGIWRVVVGRGKKGGHSEWRIFIPLQKSVDAPERVAKAFQKDMDELMAATRGKEQKKVQTILKKKRLGGSLFDDKLDGALGLE